MHFEQQLKKFNIKLIMLTQNYQMLALSRKEDEKLAKLVSPMILKLQFVHMLSAPKDDI